MTGYFCRFHSQHKYLSPRFEAGWDEGVGKRERMQSLAQLLVGLIGLFIFFWVLGPLWAIGIAVGWLLLRAAGGDDKAP